MGRYHAHTVQIPGQPTESTLEDLLGREVADREAERLAVELERIREAQRLAADEGPALRLY